MEIVMLSSRKFLAGCVIAAAALLALGLNQPLPAWFIASEVMLTILSLFLFGSMKYQIDKNALTYGAVIVIGGSFFGGWWPESGLRASLAAGDHAAVWGFFHHYFLTLHGLDKLVHADTMLFILGLTLFVAVIAQTRLLERISFAVLAKTKGAVVPTVCILAGIVSFASGILDGVSMIGLMIRTLVIILFLAKISDEHVIFSVIISTVTTTVCGMWLAYGEPPNLIMKANLHPYLDNAFFLRYCLPGAVASYLVVAWNIRKHLKGARVETAQLDILDLHTADVKFMQVARHGEALSPTEFAEEHRDLLGSRLQPLIERLHDGEPLGLAMAREKISPQVRKELLGKFISEDLAEELDQHYAHEADGRHDEKAESAGKIKNALKGANRDMTRAQKIGGASFAVFVALLVGHAVNHDIPLFAASFAGFFVALFGIYGIPEMRSLALREARHEFTEYLFLLPLFLSITLLQKTGFFEQISTLLHLGIERLGASHVAYAQFLGATFLSALLDNNVVADFASRGLHGLEVSVLHLFAMAQIAGYAAGGCWTHIGSAQSVVAYSFIRKEVDERYTPFQWIKAMTPVILEICVVMTLITYGEGLLLKYLH